MKNRKENIKTSRYSEQIVDRNLLYELDKIDDKRSLRGIKDFSTMKEDIQKTIREGEPDEIRKLSRMFFRYTIYRRMVLYLGTIFKFPYIVTPLTNKWEDEEKTQEILEKVDRGLHFCESVDIQQKFADITTRVVRDGVYYGYIIRRGNTYVIQDLPVEYCKSRAKANNRYAVEFDVFYFKTLNMKTPSEVKAVVNTMPKEAVEHYKKYVDGETNERWVLLNTDNAMCFKLTPDEIPVLSGVIPDIINLYEYKDIELSRDQMELVKILVQKLPVSNEGDILFDPAEAKAIHRDAVQMLKNTRGVDVFTTFAQPDMMHLQEAHQVIRDSLTKGQKSAYNESGISQMLFASEGNVSLENSIINDTAMMNMLLPQYEEWINHQLLRRFSTSDVQLKCMILPVTWYNEQKMLDTYMSLLDKGYSKIIPYVATGHKQQTLTSLLRMESALGISDMLEPPMTAHQTPGDRGRPEKETDEKEDTTIQREEEER